ncbi:HEPN domain-containing protein [Candidatus Woesearchaeota archaeon]|nr:HEPN domain-containing protein [Candidatus Woesearchaeota archaeon]
MRKEIENWWKQAQADLRSSQNCIKSGDFYLSVFSSQQAVEKALKALSLLKFKELPQGHSILFFAQKVKIPSEMLSGIRELNPEYLITRYPDIAAAVPADLYDLQIAKKHHLTAEKVLQWVQQQIQK